MKPLYPQIATLFKSMADENRLRIIMNLAKEGKSVSRIVEETKLSQPLISHHLKDLKNADIVQTKRKGSFVFYRLTEPSIVELIRIMNQLVIELSKKGNPVVSNDFKSEFPFPVMMEKLFKLMNQ